MAKVFAGLAASMTFGAASLMWIEPHTTRLYPDLADTGSGPHLLRARLASDTPRWQGILVEQRFDHQGPAPLSDQAEERQAYHFIIDADGFRQDCPPWRSQESIPGLQGLIRIAVQARPHASAVSMQQWQSLLELLRYLQDRYQVPNRHATFQAYPPANSDALRQQAAQLAAMLRAAGLL
jgi:hypothetical protein